MYLGSINDQVWDVTESYYAIIVPTISPTKTRPTSNAIQWLSTPYTTIDSKVFEKIKDCDRANEVWKRLEETYEGTPMVKSAKLYILKDKLISFRMMDDG